MDKLLTQVISVLEQLDPTVCLVITDDQLELPGPIIVFANRAWLELTGYTLAEVVGKTPRILQGPLTDRDELRKAKECLLNGERYTGANTNYRKDGTTYRLGWDTVKVMDEAGQHYYMAVQKSVASDSAAEELSQIRAVQETILKTLHQTLMDVLPMKDKAGRAGDTGRGGTGGRGGDGGLGGDGGRGGDGGPGSK
jgi:PAS domain S-box-containing protein